VSPLMLDREEFEAAQRVWAFLVASGHLNCGAPQRDPSWPAGRYECACKQVVLVPGGAR
jgi:hypothetical protein